MSININKESDRELKIKAIREYLDDVPTKEEIEKMFGRHSFDDVPYGYIYMVKNSKSGRCYIGQSVQGVSTSKGTFRRYPNGWVMEHWSKPEVKFDLMEYGWGSFEDIKIIALAYSKEELDILEGYWMKKTDSIISGYNTNVPYLHKRKTTTSNTRMSFSPSQLKK